MEIASRVGSAVGCTVTEVTDLGSSHGWRLARMRLADGRAVFVKHTAAHGPVLAAEAAGLRWLAEGDAELPVPVLADGEGLLVLPWLSAAAPSAEAAERFGRGLARLHTSGAEWFGAPWQGWIAELPQDNTRSSGPWSSWFAERRVVPYLRRAAGVLGAEGVRVVEQVVDRIEVLGGPAEPPARIHGDLWSGNVVWTAEGARVIDPAAHGGHRESDLAMLALFGAPYLDRILGAYQEVAPLAEGWRARVPVHQLAPLLVHVVLFGGSYRGQVIAAARAALAG
ncbi:fructosamine kinase family protein [Nocardia farcinica]|uniref:fructosamine kinase family protein n=1 Tax=Nocardia farcinica TaxID=37329 RepID=UPI0024568D1E|nr:fructosamine kinase family protein [Nocardia farcinica]